MSPEFIKKWEKLLDDVDKQTIPVEFIQKLVVKLRGRKRRTINIERFINQGLYPDEIEDEITQTLVELEDDVVFIEFILNVQSIAETVQPETDNLLRKL